MTTFTDRPATALLVIDLQQGVIEGAPQREEVLERVNALVERARGSGTAIVWVQHSADDLPQGSAPWEFAEELTPRIDTEPLVHKRHGDAFEATDLEEHLSDLGVGRVVVMGAQSDACIRSTIHGAFVRGYDVVLVEDAHTTEDLTQWGAPPPEQVIAHTNLYWGFQSGPGRTASTALAAEVDLVG